MANTIITKNSATASAVPTSGQLVQGELAVNVTDKRLFTEDSGGTVVEVGTNPSTMAVAGNATVGGTLGVTGLATLASSTLTANPTLTSGTANGVTYLNGSKVLTSGSGLTFDGSNVTLQATSPTVLFNNSSGTGAFQVGYIGGTNRLQGRATVDAPITFWISDAEQMRLTSTGLGIGTSSPDRVLDVRTAPSIDWQVRIGANNTDLDTYDIGRDVSDGLLYFYGNQSGYNGYVFSGVNGERLRIDSAGTVTHYGNTVLGDASTDTVTVNGYMGVGGSGTSNAAVYLTSTTLTGTSQYGFYSTPRGSSSATAQVAGFTSLVRTEDAVFTLTNAYGVSVENASKGASSTITNQHGVRIADQTRGTNNYGITSLVSSGTNKWNIYASGTADNYFAGNVGIGTSSPSRKLHVYDTGSIPVRFETNTSDTKIEILTTSGTQFIQGSANNLLFGTNNTERARITSAGDLLVGKASTNLTDVGFDFVTRSSGIAYSEFVHTHATDASANIYINRFNDSNAIRFLRSTVGVGSISVTSTSTAYNTSSDYRLKEDWQPMTGASERVKALKPVNFAWKTDGSRVDGFLAHEAQAVVPEAVTGTKDAVDADGNPEYQGIDQSKLVPLLTAALQEALAQIESLTARVSALEGN